MKKNSEAWFGLQDTICVVAGASGLLGKECCRALSDCGAEVIAIDIANADVKLDLTDEKAVKKFFKGLEGRKDKKSWAFINCSYPRTANWGELGFENVSLKDWNKNVELHLGSVFFFTQQAAVFLKTRGGGSIVNFGSIYGQVGPDLKIYAGTSIKNPAAYAAIKAGIAGLTRYVATTFGDYNIRANIVCPGGIENKQPASFVKAYKSRTPLGRMGNPDDIAGVVAFLVGPSARYLTGQTVSVDGGWTAW